jgi:hypothetical protein
MWRALVVCGLSAVLVAADETGEQAAETEAVRVEFMGSSGGMKIFNVNDAANFLMVQQDEMLEVDADGEMVVPPNRMNMAGGTGAWTPLTTEATGGLTSYHTTFTKVEGGKSFSLAAHVSRSTISTSEEVPCSGCADGTAGVCIDPETGECSDKMVGPPSTCPENTRECTEPIELTQDTLKFSITTEWDFVSPGNGLRYSIILKDNNGDEPVVDDDDSSMMNIEIPGSGWLEIPTTGLIVGGEEPVPVDVQVTTRTQGSQFILDFVFPHFDEGTALYYDPTLGVGERASSWKWVGLSAAGGLVAVVAVGGFSKYRSLNPKRDVASQSAYKPVLLQEDSL